MYEDHWYHSSPSQQEPSTLRRQESVRKQSPERSSQKKTFNEKKTLPGPPKAEVPGRPKSCADLRAVSLYNLVTPDGGFVWDGANYSIEERPRRPKSRNDLEDVKNARYGPRKGPTAAGASARGAAKPREIRDELDFADWYGEFEDDLQDVNSEYKLFRSTLDSHLTTCKSLLSTTDATLNMLSELESSFQTVHTQTSNFQATCSSLLTHQSHLKSLLGSISTNLHPFTELEPITRALARPGSDFVRTPSFREMLVRLDKCLAWMSNPAHKSFPDVENYAPRFRQNMTRALTLIRNYFVTNVREVANEVIGRIKERQMNDTTQSALLYAKFRVNAPLLRDLVGEIEKRCDHKEYISLLNECYSAFSSVRQKLIVPIISKRMNALAAPGSSTGKDLVRFARNGVNFVRSICMDEFELFYAYFSGEQGDQEVYNFLETLCEPLYDHLRPRIIHELQLVKLCELCTLLQTRYMRDLEDPDPDPYDRTQLDFGQLIQSTIQDTQNRIVFRAQSVIRDDIEGFSPKPEDLDYPAKNQLPKRPTGDSEIPGTPLPNAPTIIDRDDNPSGNGFDTEAVFKGWYPTLRKCIWLLSRIYRLVNSTVFDDLAHNIVHVTTISLLKAHQQIAAKKTLADGHLFLIKHLIILKEQIVAFDIEFVRPDVNIDFSALTGTFWELREKGIFSSEGIIKLVKGAAMPKVVENMLDAKVELDARLRFVINEFTRQFAGRMTAGIEGKSNKLAATKSADPAGVVRAATENEVIALRAKLEEYLEDARTRETLVAAVQELVIQAYEAYYNEAFMTGNRPPPRAPGGVVWDMETFVGWSNDVFAVGRGFLSYDGEGGGSEDMSPDRSRTGSL